MRALYQVEVGNCKLTEAFEGAREEGWEKSESYARVLTDGVKANRDEIDATIDSLAHGYSIDRIAAVDLAILRLATFELAFGKSVPPAVAIDEAVELAKKYSTEQSGSFINGILASVLKKYEIKTGGEVIGG